VNVLKSHLQTTLRALIERNASQREIERVTGIDRKTTRSYVFVSSKLTRPVS